MSSKWHQRIERCKQATRYLPMLLGLMRVLICFWPQIGYLHPDEFFQSSDIVAGKQLGIKIEPVWEFTTDRPIRCMLLPNLLNGFAFKIVKALHAQPSAYLLLVAPRLVYTLVSFSIDYCLLSLCQCYSVKGLPYQPVLIIFQSSFICFGIFTRTLSNTTEAILFAWLLVVVCKIVRPQAFRVLFITPKHSKPINQRITKSAQIISSSLVGFIVTLGTFNRPTFPCFALVPCIYWLHESYKRNSSSFRLTIQRAVIPLIITSSLMFAAISCYDTYYYRDYEIVSDILNDFSRLRLEQFYKKLRSNWIVTPYNFLVFNTNVTNLSKYGIHKPYTHLLLNLPLAFNSLAIVFYGRLYAHLVGSGIRRLLFHSHRITAMMFISAITSILLLSLIPHQEFRFLAPIVIPLVYTCASDIYHNKRLLGLWFVANFLLIYFYARIHQSGVTSALLDLDLTLKDIQNSKDSSVVSVIAANWYPTPTYLWSIDQFDNRFHLNLSATITDYLHTDVEYKINPAVDKLLADVSFRSDHKLFVMLPRLYLDQLLDYIAKQSDTFVASIVDTRHYSFHFSGEDFQESIMHVRKNGLKALREAFGFSLLQIDLSAREIQSTD